MPALPPEITVVIINYNGRRFLDELLDSLSRQSFRDFETLLIDNASTDGSADYVRNNFTRVRVAAQSENLGFSRAGNLGVKSSRSPYIAMLNTDMRVEPGWLAALYEGIRKEDDIAAAASKMRFYHQPKILNGVGGAMNHLGYAWDRGMNEEDRGQYDSPEEVLFACAGAALFRRDSFVEAGAFDEAFFMYHEDVDLGWRLWLLGCRIITAPQAIAYHHFGGSTKASQGNLWRELMGERNNIRSLLKNYEPRSLFRALYGILSMNLPRRRKLAQLRNFAWNLKLLPDTLRHRHRIQGNRRRADREISRLIVESKRCAEGSRTSP